MKNVKLVLIAFLIGFVVISIASTKIEEPQIIEPTFTLKQDFILDLDPTINIDMVADALDKYNIKFPWIVLAQALHESGRFTSNVFLKNNNLFGLKVPYSRPTTALGTKNGHAYYENWEMSILDYALYQASFTRKIKKEVNYLNYLNRNYAADSIYDIKLRKYFKETKSKFK